MPLGPVEQLVEWLDAERRTVPGKHVERQAVAHPPLLIPCALSAAGQLLHVCVHGEKWVHVPGIRWVADAVVVMRSAAVDWGCLVEEATRRRFVRRLGRQLTYLRDAVDAPVPADVLTALAAAPVSALERLEHILGVRERLPSNSLLAHWFTHARSAPAGAVGALGSFPRYLQAIWHLQGMADVPKAAVARIRRLLPRPLAEPWRRDVLHVVSCARARPTA
jgi:hypothetical protein